MKRIYFPSFDGEEISLLLPRPEAAEARPCVVFLHGGACASGWRIPIRGMWNTRFPGALWACRWSTGWPRRGAPCTTA